MLKIWGMLKKNQKIIQQIVVESDHEELSRKEELELCLEKICYAFDISKPIWLSKHESEFNQFNRTIFKAEHFMESISFDTFEIEAIIEKKKNK